MTLSELRATMKWRVVLPTWAFVVIVVVFVSLGYWWGIFMALLLG